MIINERLFRLMPYRLKRQININVQVSLNGCDLVIPAAMPDGLQNIFWKKSWKTYLIERLVQVGEGLFVDVGANVGQTLLDLH